MQTASTQNTTNNQYACSPFEKAAVEAEWALADSRKVKRGKTYLSISLPLRHRWKPNLQDLPKEWLRTDRVFLPVMQLYWCTPHSIKAITLLAELSQQNEIIIRRDATVHNSYLVSTSRMSAFKVLDGATSSRFGLPYSCCNCLMASTTDCVCFTPSLMHFWKSAWDTSSPATSSITINHINWASLLAFLHYRLDQKIPKVSNENYEYCLGRNLYISDDLHVAKSTLKKLKGLYSC